MLASVTAAGTDSAVKPAKLGLCVGCHGVDGKATLAGLPHLTGQDESYLYEQLKAYKDGRRDHAQMRAVVGSLSDADMRQMSTWYSSQRCRPE